jgi:hypothetical protein
MIVFSSNLKAKNETGELDWAKSNKKVHTITDDKEWVIEEVIDAVK